MELNGLEAVDEGFCLVECLELANIHQLETGLDAAADDDLVTNAQVEVDDAELVRPTVHHGQERGVHLMDAGECKELVGMVAEAELPRRDAYHDGVDGCGIVGTEGFVDGRKGTFHLARTDVSPADEAHFTVEDQVTLRLAFADQQRGLTALPCLPEVGQADVAEDVDVVDEEAVGIYEQRSGMLDAATSLEELTTLVGDAEGHCITLHLGSMAPEVDHVGKVMDVDDQIVESCSGQLLRDMLDERLAGNVHQGLRHGVGEGLESGAEPCGKYHGLHEIN